MKQLLFMVTMVAGGSVGAFVVNPFWGVAVYYFFAVLRPQYIWDWALPPGIPWSYYVGVAAIAAAVGLHFGLLPAAWSERDPAREPGGRRLSSAHILVFLFAAWITVTYLTAQDQSAAYPWFIEYVKIFVMFAVSTVLVRTTRQLWFLYVMCAVTFGYVAYEINFDYLVNGWLGIYHEGYGGLDNNGIGLLLAMAIPLCIFTFEATRHLWRWAVLALVPVLLHAVLMSYSRGAMVALAAASPLIYLRSRNKRFLTSALIALWFAMPLLAGQEIRERFFSIGNYETDGSAQNRFRSWAAGWRIALDNPILGVGIRNSEAVSHLYGADIEGRTIHNHYLQLAADSGFIAVALYLSMLAAGWLTIRRLRRASRRSDNPEDRRTYAMASGIECAMFIFCLGAVFLALDVLEFTYLLLFIVAQLGVLRQDLSPGWYRATNLEVKVSSVPAPAFPEPIAASRL